MFVYIGMEIVGAFSVGVGLFFNDMTTLVAGSTFAICGLLGQIKEINQKGGR